MNDLLVARFTPSHASESALKAARAALPPGVVDLADALGRRRLALAGSENAVRQAAQHALERWRMERETAVDAADDPSQPLGTLTILAPTRAMMPAAERVAGELQVAFGRTDGRGAKAASGASTGNDEAANNAGTGPIAIQYRRLPLRLFLVSTAAPHELLALARRLDERFDGYLHGLRAGRSVHGRESGLVVTIRDTDRLPLTTGLAAVRAAAAEMDVELTQARLLGLVSDDVLVDSLSASLGIDPPADGQRLSRLSQPGNGAETAADIRPLAFIDAVASDKPTPGGGSVAALVGALGAALGTMVAGLTVGRPKFAAVEADMQRVRRRCSELKNQLADLMLEDIDAFESVMAGYRLPKGTADEAEARRVAIQESLIRAIEVPLEIMQRAMDVLRLSRVAAESGNPNAVSDAGVAAYLAHAALQSASLNVEINILGLRNLDEGDRYRRQTLVLLRDARLLVDEVERIVRARMAG